MNRVLSKWVVVFALVLGGARTVRAAAETPSSSSSSSSSASSSMPSGPVCIGDQAKKTLEACPNGPTSFSGKGKQPEMSFHGKVEDVKKGDKKIEINAPDQQMTAGFRDVRQQALKQRALALLVTEIQQLESLYRSTEARSKDRPQLLRRLAEDYVELENAAFREKTEAEV